MNNITEDQHLSFLGEFHGKQVIAENKLGIFSDTFSWEGIRPDKNKTYGACRVFCDSSPYVRIYNRKKVFPILRYIDDISTDEMYELEKMSFSFEFDIKEANWEQISYLKNIGIDVPRWFSVGHPDNGKFAIDIGMAIHTSDVGDFLTQ